MKSTANGIKYASITPAQIRAARALLHWSREELVQRSGVSMRTVARLEDGEPGSEKTMNALRNTLINAGIEFIEPKQASTKGGAGVRFRKGFPKH